MPGATLAARLYAAAAGHSERLAIICGEDRLTYGELIDIVSRLAGQLAPIARDEAVAICASRHINFIGICRKFVGRVRIG